VEVDAPSDQRGPASAVRTGLRVPSRRAPTCPARTSSTRARATTVDGARVRVRSRIGVVETEAMAQNALRPGVACLPHGYGHDRGDVGWSRAAALPGVSYNDLSDPLDLDMPSGNAALNGTPVWVEVV